MMKCGVTVAGLVAVLLMSGEAQAGSRIRADNWFWRYPDEKWCHNTTDGLDQCAYATLQQCQAARSGVGGGCNLNPRYVDGVAAPAARTRRYVR